MTNYDGLYNKDYYAEKMNKKSFVDKPLYFRIIENGTILPHKGFRVNGNWNSGFGGIVDAKGKFVNGSFFCDGGTPYTPNEEVQKSPATVIYLGMFFPVWGHCITDNIKYLWFLKSEFYKNFFQSCPIVCLSWGGGGILEQFLKLLQILEVDLSRITPITKPTQFQQIILPDASFFTEDNVQHYTAEYVQHIEQIKSHAEKNFTPLAKKKYFFNYGFEVSFGEERLVKYFQSKDYEIIKPETLPLDEQLNILMNCENFASTEGSCSHNSVFMKADTEVLLIPRSADRAVNGYQAALNQICEQKVFYLDTALSIFATPGHGPFCYIISEQLRKFFGEEVTEKFSREDYEIFLQYSRFAMERGFNFNQEANRYYFGVMQEFLQGLRQNKDLLEKYKITLV